MKIEYIETEKGNEILIRLKEEGWRVADQYNQYAFDKGIDYDSYTLRKGDKELHFEWTNWFEWEIQGNEAEIGVLIKRFGLQGG